MHVHIVDLVFQNYHQECFRLIIHLGACPKCSGIGYLMKMDEDLIIPDKDKTLYDGVKAFGSSVMKKEQIQWPKCILRALGRHYGVSYKVYQLKRFAKKDF